MEQPIQEALYARYKYIKPEKPGVQPKIYGIEKTATTLAFGYARLYTNRSISGPTVEDPLKFRFMNLGGIICFVIDRRRQVKQLRVFDINNYRMIFQIELYVNMHQVF